MQDTCYKNKKTKQKTKKKTAQRLHFSSEGGSKAGRENNMGTAISMEDEISW